MAFYTAEGIKFYVSSTFAAAKTVGAITNANPAVCTATSHGYSDNDEILVLSGWEEINEMVFKVDQLTADTFSLLDLDASDINFFPAGSGAGSAKKISGWLEIPQVVGITTQGGGPRFQDVQLLASRYGTKLFTGFEGTSLDFTLAHDPANATYKTMLGFSRVGTKVAVKAVALGGAVSYGYGQIHVSENPNWQAGQVTQVPVSVTLNKKLMSYA